MTLLELATEIVKRCGEGYESYVSRAYEHIETNINALVNSGLFKEEDYPHLIQESTKPATVSSVEGSIQLDVLPDDVNEVLSVTMNDIKVDRLNVQERRNIPYISDFYKGGAIYITTDGLIEIFYNDIPLDDYTVRVLHLDPYSNPATSSQMLFSNKFLVKLIDVTAETLYREINL